MSNLYELLEEEIKKLEQIDSWKDKINNIKKLKEQINDEQEKLNNLMDLVINNELKVDTNNNKKKNDYDLELLIKSFNETINLEDRIRIYNLIIKQIEIIEKELFQ